MSSRTDIQGNHREVLIVEPFADARSDDACGEKALLGIHSASLTCGTKPGTWAAEAIAKSFADNGYVVLPAGSRPGPSTTVVHGTVTELFMTTPTDFSKAVNKLDIALQLDVTLPNGDAFEREVKASGQAMYTNEDNNGYDKAANSATMQIAGEAVEATGELLEKGAQAPGWHAPPAVPVTTEKDVGNASDGQARQAGN